MTSQPVDLDEISARAEEVHLGPWVPGTGIVNCIPELVAELREARKQIDAVRALHYDATDWCAGCELRWPCNTARAINSEPLSCETCNGIRYLTDGRGNETTCPTCYGSGDAE